MFCKSATNVFNKYNIGKLYNLKSSSFSERINCIPEYRDFFTAKKGFWPYMVNLKGKIPKLMYCWYHSTMVP